MYPRDSWKCLCGQFMLPLVETTSQVIIHLFDSYQLSNNIGKSPKNWNLAECKYANQGFRPLMEETVKRLTEKHLVFAPACYDHGLVESSRYIDIQIDGISAWNQLSNYFSNSTDKRSWLSTCQGVNCQETCRQIQTGDETYC